MRLFNIRGKLVNRNVSPYRLDWDKESRSIVQFQTKQFLKPFWFAHIMYEEFPVYGGKLKVDILNATLKLAIEVHGPQHERFHFFHNNNRFTFLEAMKNDEIKTEWLKLNNFRLLIIYSEEVKNLSKEFFLKKFEIAL